MKRRQINSDWLGITQQQLDLLLIAYDISSNSTVVSASTLLVEYQKRSGRALKQQNLFIQLKKLLKLGLLKRVNRSDYHINISCIKELMVEKRKELKEQLVSFEAFNSDLENKLKSAALTQHKPVACYLQAEEYISTITQLLNSCRKFYADSVFPNVSYTPALYSGISRSDFVNVQHERCIKLRKLQIYYLTDLNIALTFRRAVKVFSWDLKKAFTECLEVINNLCRLLEHPKLDIRYLEVLPGPHMFVFEADKPLEIILSLRGSIVSKAALPFKQERDPYGGVSIYSPEIALEARQIYLNSFRSALKLNSKKGMDIIEQVRLTLRQLYEEAQKQV